MALGLPISVAIGWTLATPPSGQAEIGAPAGTGGLGGGANGAFGTAPQRNHATQPVAAVQLSSAAAPRPVGTTTLVPATAPSAAPTPTTEAPSNPAPSSSSPTLNEPPVPTPTEITETSPTGPADPSADPSAAPS